MAKELVALWPKCS